VAIAAVGLFASSSCAVGIRGAATEIGTQAALMNGGVVSTTGGLVSYHFEYGQGDALQATPGQTLDLAAGGTEPVSEPVSGLEPGRTYRYRVCAEDSDNPGDPFCSPFRAFSTVEPVGQDYAIGTFSNSVAAFVVDVRSDPTGGDPAGEVTASEGRLGSESAHVACLDVEGNRATIGVEFSPSIGSGFFFLEDNPTGQDRFGAAALAAGQSITDCPAGPSTLDPISTGTINVHDAAPEG
jgi:hypothetical protein